MVSFLLVFSLTTIFIMKGVAGWAFLGGLVSQLGNASPTWPGHHGHEVHDEDGNKLGAVASESSICSNIGIDMLRVGGNAADSLVATVFCVGVIGMYHR